MSYQVLSKSPNRAEIHLYDDIGEGWFGGISAKQFVKDLKALGDIKELDVRINSGGGNVFDGVAIYNTLLANRARVTTHIDGLAASIASIIAMAGDEIYMADNAMLMIHDPWTAAVGNAEDLRAAADTLDTIAGTLRNTYTKRTGQAEKQVEEWMRAETWFTAAEAVEYGFADQRTEEQLMAASLDVGRFNYRNIPDALMKKDVAAAAEKRRVDPRLTRLRSVASRVPREVQNRRVVLRQR